MTLQEIYDQLELLRLKELFMSDIKIRSKMALLLSEECAAEVPPYQEFCELTHCRPKIAKMFTEKMEGEVGVESKPGVGSIFHSSFKAHVKA